MIRPATEADVAALARLWHDAWRDGHAHFVPEGLIRARTVEAFAQRLRAALPDTFFAAGAADGWGSPDAPAGLFILQRDEVYQFFVARAARGTGFSASLLAAAEAELARRGTTTAFLDCAVGNDRAARFYEKAGWRKVGQQMHSIDTAEGVFEVEHWRMEKGEAATTNSWR